VVLVAVNRRVVSPLMSGKPARGKYSASVRQRGSRKRLRRVVVALMLGTLWVSVCFLHAAAHSILKSTQPKAGSVVDQTPDHVELVFNEPVELAFGAIQVTGPDGQRYDSGDAEHPEGREDVVTEALADGLPNGGYLVRWRIIAADGHPRAGKFRFRLNAPAAVASPSPTAAESPGEVEEGHEAAQAPEEDPQHAIEEATRPAEILLGVTRWFLFAGLLLLTGVFVFFAAVWLRPKGSFGQRPPEVEEAFARRTNRLLRIAWRTAFLATLVSIPLQASVAAGVGLGEISGSTVGDVFSTRFGTVALLRLGLLVALALVWPWVRRAVGLHPSAPAREPVPASVGAAAVARRPLWPLVVGIPTAAALLLTIGLAGHAGTLSPVALNLTADLVHLLGVAVWLGGLIGLVLLAFPATRGVSETDRVGLLAPVVSRFSDFALVAVAVIVASGVIRGYLEIRSIAELTGSSYGITLMVKLAAFLPLIALGAINNRWTKPRIERAAASGAPSPQLSTLRRLVTVEVVLGIVILGVTAVLVALAPPIGTHV
jgi:copper transport protein